MPESHQPLIDPLGVLKEQLPETIARAVLAHPAVHELDGGPHGTVASYLVGRRVLGVRATDPGEPVELSVVLLLGYPIPEVVAELRAIVADLAGGGPVHVRVSDLHEDLPEPEGAG